MKVTLSSVVILMPFLIHNCISTSNTTQERCGNTIRGVLKSTLEELYQQQCPNQWYRILDSCIWYSNEQLNFHDANQRCNQLVSGGRLFEPMTQLQNNLVQQLGEDLPDRTEEHLWIGISDEVNEGEFVYLSSGSNVTFSDFARIHAGSDEPNGGDRENCVDLIRRGPTGYAPLKSGSGSWNDMYCSRLLYFICEKLLK